VSGEHDDGTSLTSRLLGWVRGGSVPMPPGGRDAGPPVGTKVLDRFLRALSSVESPSLLDLGPVVGSNVSFFGEQLGCKLQVEDLYADIERMAVTNATDTWPAFLEARFTYPVDSFDGILCWDVFDYLDKSAAQTLGRVLAERLKPGGALLAFFQTTANHAPQYTKYVIVDPGHLQHRVWPAAEGRRTVFQNRDIDRLFPGLAVAESFLMLNRTREILFRRRSTPSAR
jgi:hypothetical protein